MVNFAIDISVTEGGRKKPQYTLDSDLRGEITLQELLQFTKSALIVIADQALKEEQSLGFDKNPIMLVDGRKTKNIQDVSPLGKIQFISRKNISEIMLASYESLLELSKVKTGLYKSSHYVFFNGTQVATDLTSLEAWLKTNPQVQEKDTIRIVNIQPYGRRLELLGVTSTRQQARREDKGRRKGIKTGITIKKPNGAYQLTYRRIKSKFKSNIDIFFKFIPGSYLGLTAYNQKFRKGRKTERPGNKTSAGRTYLYPSLVFKIVERGLTNV